VRTCTVASARDQQAAAAGHKSIKELQGAAAAAAAAAAKTTTKKNGKKRGTGLKQHVAVAVAAAAAAAAAGAQAVAASSHPGSCTTKKQHVQAEVLQTSCFIPKSPTTSARSSKPSSAYSHESRISSCPPAAPALELLEGATAVSATQLHQYSRNHHQSLQGNSISHDTIHPAGAIISGAVEDHDQRDLESRELLETSCCCSSSSSSNVLQSTNMQQLQDHHDAAHDTRFLKPM
jgi:hypothetical protein